MTPSPDSPSRRFLSRIGVGFHYLALACLLAALAIIVFGGFELRLFFLYVGMTRLKNSLQLALLLTLLGWILAPSFPWRSLPAARAARGCGAIWRRLSASGTGRVVLVCALLVLGAHLFMRARQVLLAAQADHLMAMGRHLDAAEIYERAGYKYTLEPARYAENQAHCLYAGSRFEKAVAKLKPRFDEGQSLTRKGYLALWRSLAELGRYEEAAQVVRAAIGAYPSMGARGAEALAIYERRVSSNPGSRVTVRLTFRAPAGAPGPFWVSGNWSADGRPSEVYGWSPLALERGEQGTWSIEVRLSPLQDFPYAAVVTDSAEPLHTPALAWGLFWVSADRSATRADVTLQALVPAIFSARAAAARAEGRDGRGRVLALWPDGGSWFILNLYAHLGYLPNLSNLLRRGARMEMLSTKPPFTSTAYLRMVQLDPGAVDAATPSAIEAALIQVKGIPFLDWLIPDSTVTEHDAAEDSIFSILARQGRSAANLVFNDRNLSALNDLTTNHGERLEPEDDDSPHSAGGVLGRRARIVRDILGVDSQAEPERFELLASEGTFLGCVTNTENKAEIGLQTWVEERPDFMLLRFPAVDILSHRYYNRLEESPTLNVVQEAYRQLDGIVARFVPLLDQDDTLILVSDHGIFGPLFHHSACLLVAQGPGFEEGSAHPTIPIGHFPCVVLSRFGIRAGSERLSAATAALLYGGGDGIRADRSGGGGKAGAL